MLISVLIITYQRHRLLEEALYSFLQQDYQPDTEVLIVNDSTSVEYRFDHPRVRIINHSSRFPSLLEKLKFGFENSRGQNVYRLDDDDLMMPWALSLVESYIVNNPGYDVYRCQNHYNFNDNRYYGLGSNINNGNCYTKEYLNQFAFDSVSFGEDVLLTCGPNTRMYNGDTGKYSMVYRWGMETFHVSGWGIQTPEQVNQNVDNFVRNHSEVEQGVLTLNPHFRDDYYAKITQNIRG